MVAHWQSTIFKSLKEYCNADFVSYTVHIVMSLFWFVQIELPGNQRSAAEILQCFLFRYSTKFIAKINNRKRDFLDRIGAISNML